MTGVLQQHQQRQHLQQHNMKLCWPLCVCLGWMITVYIDGLMQDCNISSALVM